ncbi:CYFIP-related Rac1 interactor B-like isoform X2 [Sycon ciliatum]|uniref:CYFIP-related Rac1 interactor B-like isoform X2 n=1 Tax=Sycon ciliatum TaxID=27933 RepID=UPI0020A85C08|eukprot:scpid69599/ scgid4462/ Protein FAM49B; L1 &gt; Protein FAM49B
MGSLLAILSDKSHRPKPDFYLDFEVARPTDNEKDVYAEVEAVLESAKSILEELRSYEGASDDIRQAISNPSDDALQQKAWDAVSPSVLKLKNYFDYSSSIEAIVPKVLGFLTNSSESVLRRLEEHQAIAKQLAHILQFTLSFDDMKMTNPAIQNDFSYYRRTQSRMRMEGQSGEVVSNEMANRMSLFYANPTPMLKTVSDSTSKFVEENKDIPIENTAEVLSTLAELCRIMVETQAYRERFQSADTVLFCLQVMVGNIILYDHTQPAGAFCKKSSIDVRQCVKLLRDMQEENPAQQGAIESLINALKYTTKHLNDETTPKHFKQLLA